MVGSLQSGRTTLGQIESGLDEIRQEEASIKSALESATREQGDLVARRLEALKDLARLRMRDALSDGIIDEADYLSTEVATILAARLKAVQDLEARHNPAEAARRTAVAEHDQLSGRIADLEARLDALADEARAKLAGDPSHQGAVAAQAALAETVKRANEKAEAAVRAEVEKGKPYRSDPLFMYLWDRKFATSDYTATGLVRWLDGKVADLVRYPGARANYAVLTEIPVRLKAHAEALQRQHGEAQRRVEVRVAETITALAGRDLVADLGAARAAQETLVKRIQAATAEITETGAELKRYAEGTDPSYQRAVGLYTDFIDKEPQRRLMSEALRTRTVEDDRIVERIGMLGRDVARIAETIAARRADLDRLFRRREELARIATDFRRQRYEDSGSVFSNNPDLGELLRQVLSGAITAADYWARTRRQQSWRHRPADPWRRSSGLPPFDTWGTGGSSTDSGPSFPDSGPSSSGSGDDFETGGRF